ncbi:MAG: adenosine deaminase [Elusimicrobia bacterium]|nr:adenosine deaminase [Elusimicrobiota bacterium]
MSKGGIIARLPKVDLHCHLDGSIRTATILDLAKKQNYRLPASTVEELRPYVRVPLDCKSLGDFLKRFEVFYPLLTNSSAMERIAYELLRDCSAENVKYLEMRFAPVLQRTGELSIPEVTEAVIKGVLRGEKEFSIKCGIILCLYRSTSLEDSMETARCAVKYRKERVCGIDIAGDETRYPLDDFVKPVEFCKKEGINITIHAGEASGPQNIRKAVEMGADRIGHGISLIKDRKLMEEVASRQIPLEICLTSNVHTQVVEDYDRHPVRDFIKSGVKVTLNTDDRGVSGIDLTYEYEKALGLGISLEELGRIIEAGAESAFLGGIEKETLRNWIANEVNNLI